MPLAAIVTSPLERCRQTATAVARAQEQAAAGTEDRAKGLTECDYGDWQGQAIKTLAKDKLWPVIQARPSAVDLPRRRVDVGDAARAVAAVRRHDADVGQEHGDHAVWAAVSHGDVIKAIVADALGMHLDLFQRSTSTPRRSRSSPTPRPVPTSWRSTRTPATCPGSGRRPAAGPGKAPGGSSRRWRRWAGSTVGIGWHAWVPSFMDSIRRSASWPARSALPDSAPSSSRHAPEHASRASALEKQQVAVLAERIDELLDEVMAERAEHDADPRRGPARPRRQGSAGAADRGGVPGRHDDACLGAEGRAGRDRGVPLHRGRRRLAEQLDEDLEEPEPDEVFVVRITAGAARAFVKRAEHARRGGPAGMPVLRQPDRPRRPSVRAGQRLPPPRTRDPDPAARPRCGPAGPRRPDHAGLQRHVPGPDRRDAGSSTSRSAGERPLWDFPDGTLADREVAAYVVSEALGWNIVPLTFLREGPHGAGMVQVWQEPDPEQSPVDLVAPGDVPDGWRHVLDALGGDDAPVSLIHEDSEPLRRMAVFDAVVNNADRKGGHVLGMTDGHRYGVDHGVTFNADPKLRTVLWGWAGEPLDATERAGLEKLLDDPDLDNAAGRTAHGPRDCDLPRALPDAAATAGAFPRASSQWPAIPWPAF